MHIATGRRQRRESLSGVRALVVRWRGKRWLLFGDLDEGGPIATRTQYRHGLPSEAHLTPDGSIMRFHRQIGHRGDLSVLGSVRAPKVGLVAFAEMLDALLAGGWKEPA